MSRHSRAVDRGSAAAEWPPAADAALAPATREPYLPCIAPAMQALAASAARVARTGMPVLICGDTGVGKTALAHQLHADGPYAGAPLISVDAAAVSPDSLHQHFAQCTRGLLIEEIADLSAAAQDRLARLLGRTTALPQFIATTRRDLAGSSHLRSDLLYRIDVVRLEIPPLRDRAEDILFLARHFLLLAAEQLQRPVHALGSGAEAALSAHSWPGNVRELRNCMLAAVVHCPGRMVRASDLHIHSASVPEGEAALATALEHLHAGSDEPLYHRAERVLLRWALQHSGGNQSRAAALLGIGRGALRAKLRRYGNRPRRN